MYPKLLRLLSLAYANPSLQSRHTETWQEESHPSLGMFLHVMLRCKDTHTRDKSHHSLRPDSLALGACENREYYLRQILSEDPQSQLGKRRCALDLQEYVNTHWDCYKALNPWQKLKQGHFRTRSFFDFPTLYSQMSLSSSSQSSYHPPLS